nr:MAG TPA: hypothetical protein [Caudoviricetes sp.]
MNLFFPQAKKSRAWRQSQLLVYSWMGFDGQKKSPRGAGLK